MRALRNAVRDGRVGDAYLLSGPRGTGKTSTARILAKALNCEHLVEGEPCGECESCKAIELGTSFDVFELDAASNNGVDAIRELIGKAALGTPGRTKVYILDEVHMLSTPASNALLKTLEEPPPHVVFVLATTDPQKVLPTIKSRTQHLEVHLLAATELESLVRDVVSDAGLEVAPEAIDYVVRTGAGSARDTLSALDQVVAAGQVPEDTEALDELVESLCERDTGRALSAVEAATSSGRSPRALGEQLMARLRDVFLASVGASPDRLPDGDRERVTEQAARLTPAGATRALEALGEAFVRIGDAPDPRITLEVALVRLTRPEADISLTALADRITRLERGVGTTDPPVPAQSVGAAPAPDSAPAATPAAAPESTGTARPADGARRALADRRASSRTPGAASRPAAMSSRPESPEAAPSTEEASPAETTTPKSAAPKSAAGKSAAGKSAAGKGSAAATPDSGGRAESEGVHGLPTRDELTLVWGDTILPALGRAKPRFSGGRWIGIEDGFAVYGLPNKIHAAKCEEIRPEVEAALAAHFGRPVPMRIVVDTGAGPPTDTDPDTGASDLATRARTDRDNGAGKSRSGYDAEPDHIDPSELVDADDAPSTGVERISEVFPGAELVEED